MECFCSILFCYLLELKFLLHSNDCYDMVTLRAEAGLLIKKLRLSSSFRCDQIYKYEINNFGHTLLCYLSRT
jgi:hypothetical protein